MRLLRGAGAGRRLLALTSSTSSLPRPGLASALAANTPPKPPPITNTFFLTTCLSKISSLWLIPNPMLQCVKYRSGANQRASASLRELCEFARLGEGSPFGENVTDHRGADRSYRCGEDRIAPPHSAREHEGREDAVIHRQTDHLKGAVEERLRKW